MILCKVHKKQGVEIVRHEGLFFDKGRVTMSLRKRIRAFETGFRKNQRKRFERQRRAEHQRKGPAKG